MKFVALDFETANPSFASICQIGVVVFNGSEVAETWHTLVDPQDYFHGANVSIHGIQSQHVKGAPTFPDVFDRLSKLLTGEIVTHHCAFDRAALTQVVQKHKLPEVACTWLDTAKVARRAWAEFATSGYGLKNVARTLGIEFSHHSAHEDARASGEILLHAIRHSGIDLAQWLLRVQGPINPSSSDGKGSTGKCAREGHSSGPLFGETIVFTGTLSLVRAKAAEIAANAGCQVADNVSKKTTLLVVGNQDIRVLAGQTKSSKHRDAEERILKGQAIRILAESDFECLMQIEGAEG